MAREDLSDCDSDEIGAAINDPDDDTAPDFGGLERKRTRNDENSEDEEPAAKKSVAANQEPLKQKLRNARAWKSGWPMMSPALRGQRSPR